MVDFHDRRPEPYFTKGGQGKFFPDEKPVNQHRYQRGYTPERMQEVRHSPSFRLGQIRMGGSDYDFSHQKYMDRPFGGPAGKRHAHEVIARSTVPVSDLDEHGQDQLIQLGHYRQNATGIFHEPRGGRTDSMITLSADAGGGTLLHELGHYSSHLAGTGTYKTPVQVGKEEARADDYMVQHFRPDPRDVRRGDAHPPTATYEKSGSMTGKGGKRAYEAYVKGRQTLSFSQKARIFRTGNLFGFATKPPAPLPGFAGYPFETPSPPKAADQHGGMTRAQLNAENDKLFHRTHEEEPGEPAIWEANPQHIWNDRRG